MTMRRTPFSIRDTLLLTTGMLALLVTLLVTHAVYAEWRRLEKILALKDASLLGDLLFDAAGKLSVEQSVALSMLHAADPVATDGLRARLDRSRLEVDQILRRSTEELRAYDFQDVAASLRDYEAHFENLQKLRRRIDAAMNMPPNARDYALTRNWFDTATGFIAETHVLWMVFITHFTGIDPFVSLQIRFKHLLGLIMENSGKQRNVIGQMLAQNADPTPEDQARLIRWRGMVDVIWSIDDRIAIQAGLYPALAPYFKEAQSHDTAVYEMVQDMFYVPGAKHGAAYPITTEFWLDLSTPTIDSLYALENAAMTETRRYVEKLAADAHRTIAMHAVILLFALLVCGYSFRVVIGRVIRPIHAIVAALMSATERKASPFPLPDAGRQDEISKLVHVLEIFRQNMEKIRRTSTALERSNKELNDFAYIASHDLKEPLRGMHNHACFLLEDNAGKLDAESVGRLKRLSYLSQRMERLINDLLYFSRIGRQELTIRPVDMNDAARDVADTLDAFLRARRASVRIPRPLPSVACDKARVAEVFRHLIVNAAKYNDRADKEIEIGFADNAAAPDGGVVKAVFYVKDNGRGIPVEFHDDIFRIFKRLQPGDGTVEEGTGVGLTFVKKIIERHGGRIWLESETGKDTIFYFTLTAGDGDAA